MDANSNDSNSRAIRAHSLSNTRFQGISPVNFAPESIASKSKAWMVGGASPAGKFNWRSISQVPIDLFFLPVGQLNTNSESKYGGLILETGDAPGIFKGCGVLTINDNTTSLFDVSGNLNTRSSKLLSNTEPFDGRVRTISII